MSIVAAAPAGQARQIAAPVRLVEKYFYTLMSLLIAAVVTYGFSRTVDQNLVHPAVRRPGMLWLHGVIFSGWLAFFILQSLLVRVRSIRLHRTLGWFGAALGTAVTVVGVAITITMTRFHLHQLHETDMSFVIVPLWDITVFTVFFVLSIAWRKRPEFHRRLALLATCALSAAGIGRFPPQIVPPGMFYAGVDLLILLGVGRDLLVDRRVHAVYRVSLPILVLGQAAVMFLVIAKPEFWMKMAAAIGN